MTEWSDGYVSEISYTFGYYQELNPLRIKLAFLQAGLTVPEILTSCELGFGQGISANIHATASGTRWMGTDFNPAQAGFAQELAGVSGCNAQFFDQSFAEFCNRTDLPDFDFIGLHGIWSWISDDNRRLIVDFIRRKLKVGGVLYISYNTMPGWATLVPLRNLLTEHEEVIGAMGQGIVPRIDSALDFAERLLAVNPQYSRANPQIAERLQKIKSQNRNYIAHEYFNRDWLPMSFSNMAEWLAPTKLNFACSAHFLDYIHDINLSKEQQAFLDEVPDAMFRETVRDFIINQQFRRDYWVKGGRRLKSLEQSEALRALRVILIVPRDEISLQLNAALGQINLSPDVHNPVLDVLADYKIKTIEQIEAIVTTQGLNFFKLIQAIIMLTGAGWLAAAQDDKTIAIARKNTEKLNKHFLNKARYGADFSYVVSPVTGGGLTLGRFQQLFLYAANHGLKQPADWAQFVWEILNSQSQKIIKEGQVLETEAENLAELNSQAQTFAEKTLPLLKALLIA